MAPWPKSRSPSATNQTADETPAGGKPNRSRFRSADGNIDTVAWDNTQSVQRRQDPNSPS